MQTKQEIKQEDIETELTVLELEELNSKYRCILQDQENEKILYRPILVEKTKPKNTFGCFQNQSRYLMFTNQKLYTLKKEEYEKGSIEADKLIANQIDIEYLSHLIIFPQQNSQLSFDQLSCLNLNQIEKNGKQVILEGLKHMKAELIIGFQTKSQYGENFNESDIALSSKTTMYDVLQLIHVCQLVKMHAQQDCFHKYLERTSSFEKRQQERNRGTTLKPQYIDEQNLKVKNYIQLFYVQSFSNSGQKMKEFKELKKFYRDKESPADIQIYKQPKILQQLDTSYYLNLFWSIEENSMPAMLKYAKDQEIQDNEADNFEIIGMFSLNKQEENSQMNVTKSTASSNESQIYESMDIFSN